MLGSRPVGRSPRLMSEVEAPGRKCSAHCQMQKSTPRKFHFKTSLSRFTSLDHLVGEQLNRVRHLNAECPCRLQVDDELELAGLQNRQVGGLRALEDSTGVDADLMPLGRCTWSSSAAPASTQAGCILTSSGGARFTYEKYKCR